MIAGNSIFFCFNKRQENKNDTIFKYVENHIKKANGELLHEIAESEQHFKIAFEGSVNDYFYIKKLDAKSKHNFNSYLAINDSISNRNYAEESNKKDIFRHYITINNVIEEKKTFSKKYYSLYNLFLTNELIYFREAIGLDGLFCGLRIDRFWEVDQKNCNVMFFGGPTRNLHFRFNGKSYNYLNVNAKLYVPDGFKEKNNGKYPIEIYDFIGDSFYVAYPLVVGE